MFETRKDNWPDTATRLPNDASSGGVDYYVTGDESSSVKESERSSEISNENDVTENENMRNDSENTEFVSNGGADITVPRISHNEKTEENSSPRGGKYILRPNPFPNFTDEHRY